MSSHRRAQRESGQALVEAALVLPLNVFLILGTLQLFLMLQGRLVAELAAFKAVRVGVVNHGSCERMTHSAIATLLPSFTTFLGPATPGGSAAEKLAEAFRQRTQGKPNDNQYQPGLDGPHDGAIVWLLREQPTRAALFFDVDGFPPEENFDDPYFVDLLRPPDALAYWLPGYRLELRLVYWFPLRVPFANWVMATMFKAHFGLEDHRAANPTLLAERESSWTAAPGAQLDARVRAEFRSRFARGQYVFPIQATAGLRMFTPPRRLEFLQQNCAPAPQL